MTLWTVEHGSKHSVKIEEEKFTWVLNVLTTWRWNEKKSEKVALQTGAGTSLRKELLSELTRGCS